MKNKLTTCKHPSFTFTISLVCWKREGQSGKPHAKSRPTKDGGLGLNFVYAVSKQILPE